MRCEIITIDFFKKLKLPNVGKPKEILLKDKYIGCGKLNANRKAKSLVFHDGQSLLEKQVIEHSVYQNQ